MSNILPVIASPLQILLAQDKSIGRMAWIWSILFKMQVLTSRQVLTFSIRVDSAYLMLSGSTFCFEKILYMFSWELSKDINILSWIFIVSVVWTDADRFLSLSCQGSWFKHLKSEQLHIFHSSLHSESRDHWGFVVHGKNDSIAKGKIFWQDKCIVVMQQLNSSV